MDPNCKQNINNGQLVNKFNATDKKSENTSIDIKQTIGTTTTVTSSTSTIAATAKAPTANAADVYETDEIEFLLDEIKDLEAPPCCNDSEQDFEIAGSRADLDLSLHLDSPIDSSWYVLYMDAEHFSYVKLLI